MHLLEAMFEPRLPVWHQCYININLTKGDNVKTHDSKTLNPSRLILAILLLRPASGYNGGVPNHSSTSNKYRLRVSIYVGLAYT